MKALMATMPSPPGRFSTTTDWPHFLASASPTSRAVRSTPEPGPSETMKRTLRSGHAEAGAAAVSSARPATAAAINLRMIVPPMAFFLCGSRFYASRPALTTRVRKRLFRRDAKIAPAAQLGQAFGEALAFRIDQRRGAGRGDRIGGTIWRDLAGDCGADHPLDDGAVIGAAARMGVAIPLDQPRTFGDFEREVRR